MSRILPINAILTFGKHEGEVLEEVIVEHPDYIRWCIEELDWFEIDEEAEELLALAERGEKRR